MQPLFRSGRYLFAMAILAFGIIQFVNGNFLIALFPLPENFSGRIFLMALISTLFVGAGIGMMINKIAIRFALLTAILFLIFMIYPHLFKLFTDLHNGGEWTVVGEIAALMSGALILAGKISDRTSDPDRSVQHWYTYGRIIFAISLLIFGILHFVYADYIATLITAWIPFKLFWSYFVGLAFVAAFLGILTNVKIYLASVLLGFMFLFWVIFLHLPRLIAKPNVEPEWTSFFIAVAFCGIFFMIAERQQRGLKPGTPG